MKHKPIIIALVGPSGSGKTTLSLHLEEHYNIPAICSYTTRPIREGEQNGREHWFVDSSHPIPLTPLAYTFFGGHHYWTEKKQVGEGLTTYVIDERGLLELVESWHNDFDIISVYITRTNCGVDAERSSRDENRIILPDCYYDTIINNDGTQDEFFSKAVDAISKLVIFHKQKQELSWQSLQK